MALTLLTIILLICAIVVINSLRKFPDEKSEIYNPIVIQIEEPNNLLIVARSSYPSKISEYIGHKLVVEQLKMSIDNYHNHGRVPKHILLYGQGGLGKTNLSEIFANEIGAGYVSAIGEEVQDINDIDRLLEPLQRGSILQLDEVHNVSTRVLEYLYSVLQDFKITQGSTLREFPQFTFIGATTNAEDLPDPFLQRITEKYRLERYPEEEIFKILPNCVDPYIQNIEDEAILIIARISQGTIRIARNEFLEACTKIAIHQGVTTIDEEIIRKVIQLKEIDFNTGLNKTQLKILSALSSGNAIGQKNLAFKVGIGPKELEEFVEPTLLLDGYVDRTARGRIITSKGLGVISGYK